MRTSTALFVGLAGVVSALWVGACSSDPHQGYAFASAHSKQVRTIEVPLFKNKTSEPGLEMLLTDAIIKQLQSKGFTVRQSVTADTTLAGTITTTEMRVLSLEHRTGLVQEECITLTVDFEWRDNRTGQAIVSRKHFSASDTFAPAAGATTKGEPIEAGRYSATDRLARDVVAELQTKW